MAERNEGTGKKRIRELLERAFAGDEEAFTEFYAILMPIVEKTIRKRARLWGKHDLAYQTLEDIRQTTFMRFWNYAKNPNKRRSIVDNVSYICGIARNETYNELARLERGHVPIYSDLDEDGHGEVAMHLGLSADIKVLAEEFVDTILIAVFSLRPRLYKVLRLHWLGYTNEEIGYSFATLKFSVELKSLSSLDKGDISEELYRKFESNRISLSRDVRVLVKERGNRWLITEKDDEERAFTVRKEPGKLSIALIKPKSIASDLSKARRNIGDYVVSYYGLPSVNRYEAILEILGSDIRFLNKFKNIEDNVELRKKLKIMMKRRNAK